MPPRPAVPPSVRVSVYRDLHTQARAPERSVSGATSPLPTVNFAALGDDDTSIPPDTNGAVGPDHLMVALNNNIRIQSRTGTTINTVSEDFFWSSTGASDIFDPHVSYDPYGNRWIFAALSNPKSAGSSVLLGVTQTNDPTGAWNLYRVDVDSKNILWADYPSLGFNSKWVVVTVNMFSISGDVYGNSSIFAFDKANLYAGGPGNLIRFDDPYGFTQAPSVTLGYDYGPGTVYLVEDWIGNYKGQGYLRVSTLTGAVGNETYTPGWFFVVTTSPWEDAPPGGADFAPQLGSTKKIQNNDARILSCVLRNASLWVTHTVFLPAGAPTRAAAQWWSFSEYGVSEFGRVDDPTGAVFYAFPTLAVNKFSDVLLGYSQFTASQYAAAAYSFRAGSDPANTMESGVVLKTGEAGYYKTFGGPDNRWGDYSSAVVDPVNDVDLWTIQEYAASPKFANGDDPWGTWWGKVVPPFPLVTFSPASLDFGYQPAGTTSPPLSVTLTNTGGAALSNISVSLTGDYSQTNNCAGVTIPVNGNCTITVRFTPFSNLLFNGQPDPGHLSINDNARDSPQTYFMTGKAFEPQLNLSALSLTFGPQAVGTTSAAQAITVNNGGAIAFNLNLGISGDFAKTTTCGNSLAGGASCSITVTFTPTAAGARAGWLSVNDGSLRSPRLVRLSGIGTSSVPVGPKVSLSNVSFNFGTQATGTTGSTKTVTLTNSGDSTLTITTVSPSGDFAQTNSCGSVSAGGACTLNVSFTPTVAGRRTGSLKVVDNAAGSPHVIRLFGTGTSTGTAPAIGLSSLSVNFGNQPLHTLSAPRTVTVTNTGNATLNITFVGTIYTEFSVSGCVTSLAPGASCIITITFAPATTGDKRAYLSIADNAPGSPHRIWLFGRGT